MQASIVAEHAIRPHEERIVHPWVTIRRTRVLPLAGQILCRRGEVVAADTVVGETDLPGGYLLVDLDHEFRARVRDARSVMRKQVGDSVFQGETLARAGLFLAKYVCPVDGTIVDIRDSRVLIKVASQLYQLVALYPGQVMEVIPQTAVVLETTGALVQGDWGMGKTVRALLHCPVPAGDVPLVAGQIAAEHGGGILVGGRGLDAAAITRAAEMQVRGVIVGSIHSDLIPIVQASGLSLIVSEGLGDTAMPGFTFELLTDYVGQEVSFSPTSEGTAGALKPELFGYTPIEERHAPPTQVTQGTPFQVGAQVRVLRAPYQYAEGAIVSLPDVPQRLASGLYAWGAEVDLESTERVFVPFQNLESIR